MITPRRDPKMRGTTPLVRVDAGMRTLLRSGLRSGIDAKWRYLDTSNGLTARIRPNQLPPSAGASNGRGPDRHGGTDPVLRPGPPGHGAPVVVRELLLPVRGP